MALPYQHFFKVFFGSLESSPMESGETCWIISPEDMIGKVSKHVKSFV